jgi:hypothetical protein
VAQEKVMTCGEYFVVGAIIGHMLYRVVKVATMFHVKHGIVRRQAEPARGNLTLTTADGRVIGTVHSIQATPVTDGNLAIPSHHSLLFNSREVRDWIVFYKEIDPIRIQVDKFDFYGTYCVFIKDFWVNTKKLQREIKEVIQLGENVRVAKWTFRIWFQYMFLGKKHWMTRTCHWGEADMTVRPQIRYADLQNRRYPVLDRAIDRMAQAMAIGEDQQAIFSMGSSVQVPPDQKDPEIEAWEERWHRRK